MHRLQISNRINRIMTPAEIKTLSNLIVLHPVAWHLFAECAPQARIQRVTFDQSRGSYILLDEQNTEHRFREYRGQIVAIVSPIAGNWVFVNAHPVAL